MIDLATLQTRLRSCATVPEVNATVKEIAPTVSQWMLDPERKSHAILIRNLAAYQRLKITGDLPKEPT